MSPCSEAVGSPPPSLGSTRCSPIARQWPEREVLRILVDRRRAIGEKHTYKTNQLHPLCWN
jgi:hypothetical protein